MDELLTTAEMAVADRLTIEGGTPGLTLMEAAGRAVADYVAEHHGEARRVAVIAGPGNNGGDGFVAARWLRERGCEVRVLLVGRLSLLRGDAARAAALWTGPTLDAAPAAVAGADVVIDALFGAGLDRPVAGLSGEMIAAMNDSARPVIAVDLPSGVNGTTGQIMGEAVRASASVTFFRRKPGHLLLPGRLHCGHVVVADIGIPATVLSAIAPKTFQNGPPLWGWAFRFPKLAGHKYGRGHAVVLSGPQHATGAARLAARGALRIGAGLVSIASPRDAVAVNAAGSLAVMVKPADGANELSALLSDRRFSAVVLGPGLGVGASTRDLAIAALRSEAAVVLDADALTSFEDRLGELKNAIVARSSRPTVLTPHDGEFKRLFGGAPEVFASASKAERCRAAAMASAAVVLLKGADTVVASPDGRAAINDNAPPWLATAGAGDVLAGFIGGLLAQGMPAFDAANAAVWLHGEAGQEAGLGLIAEDLPEAIPAVYRRLSRTLDATA